MKVINRISQVPKQERRTVAAARLTRFILKCIERAEGRKDSLAITEGWDACLRVRQMLDRMPKETV